jgi:ribonuclease HI
MLASQMKRFSILEEMERLSLGHVATPTKQQTIDAFFAPRGHIQTQISSVIPSPPIPTCPAPTEATTIYNIFTDGACPNNGRKGAKASYGIVFLGISEQGPPLLEIAQPVPPQEPQTNQRAELSAIYNALQIVQERNIWKEASKICIWTDSQYAIKCITEWGPGWKAKGWKKRDGKPIEHLDILKPLILLREEKASKFSLRYVEAHQSAVRSQQFPWRWNARADALAQASSNS